MEITWDNAIWDLSFSKNTIKLVLFVLSVCLVQWIVYFRIRQKSQIETDSIRNMLREVENELDQAHRDRSLFHLESQVLHELLSLSTPERMLGRLLRYFTPLPEHGFSAFVEIQGSKNQIRRSRGLSDHSIAGMFLDVNWLSQLQNEPMVIVNEAELVKCGFCKMLDPNDRQKMSQLFLVPVRDDQDLTGVLVSTHLFPLQMSLSSQKEFVQRLVAGVSIKLHELTTHQMHKSELRLTREMLALRSITDREYDSPLLMIEAFLNRLLSMVDADRVSLQFLYGQISQAANSRSTMLRCGQTFPVGVLQAWNSFEEKLTSFGANLQELNTLRSEELVPLGVDRLIGSALVIPLHQKDSTIGVICCTRRDNGAFSDAQVALAKWASEYLTETILKALNYAAVEREARLDGLTHLANRRSFDKEIIREVETARRLGRECSLGLFDLDHFKSVNDQYGHQLGDEVLIKVAKILENQTSKVRATDRPLVARYGGEELAVLLPGVGLQGATRIAESIREAVQNTVFGEPENSVRVTVSGGLACFPRNAEKVADLIKKADDALYEAKNSGRNRICTPNKLPQKDTLAPKKNRIKNHLENE